MIGPGELSEAIADNVNRTCRRGESKYTAADVSFASGDRLALQALHTILSGGSRIACRNPDHIVCKDYHCSLRNRCVLLPMLPWKMMPSPSQRKRRKTVCPAAPSESMT